MTGGLGPIKLISPLSTLNTCVSSSKLYRLKNLPILVIRLSCAFVNIPVPILSALRIIVQNLTILNTRKSLPIRSCKKNGVPRSSNMINIAIKSKKGERIRIRRTDPNKSKSLLSRLCISMVNAREDDPFKLGFLHWFSNLRNFSFAKKGY